MQNISFDQYTPEQLEQLAQERRAGIAGQGVDMTPPHVPGYAIPAPASSPQVRTLPRREDGTIGDGDPYAVTAWGSQEYDFRVPSGQLCRMKKLRPEELIGSAILDKITRLPGYSQELIDQSEGKPPVKKDDEPDAQQLAQVVSVLDELIPMVVVKPVVRSTPPEGAERVPGVVYTDDIELADRIAIMERATSGVVRMDNFREES